MLLENRIAIVTGGAQGIRVEDPLGLEARREAP